MKPFPTLSSMPRRKGRASGQPEGTVGPLGVADPDRDQPPAIIGSGWRSPGSGSSSERMHPPPLPPLTHTQLVTHTRNSYETTVVEGEEKMVGKIPRGDLRARAWIRM